MIFLYINFYVYVIAFGIDLLKVSHEYINILYTHRKHILLLGIFSLLQFSFDLFSLLCKIKQIKQKLNKISQLVVHFCNELHYSIFIANKQ